MKRQEALDAAVAYALDELGSIGDDYGDFAEGMAFMLNIVDEADLATIIGLVGVIKKRLIKYTEENMGDLSD